METFDLGDKWTAVILHDVQTGKPSGVMLKHKNRIIYHEKIHDLPYQNPSDLMRALVYRKTLAMSGYRAAILDMKDRFSVEFRDDGGGLHT